MRKVWLVRHGQASFGSDDYDQLSVLGDDQCHRLGRYWQGAGVPCATVLQGALKRHAQSFSAMRRGWPQLPSPLVLPELNEYDSEALLAAMVGRHGFDVPLERVAHADLAREFFKRLRLALLQWVRADVQPDGMPSFAIFKAGIVDALDRAHRASRDGNVLVVSSGGPISVAVAHVLGAPDEAAVALNMRLRNSAITELASTSRGFELVSFNALPHLEGDALSHSHA